MKKCVHAAIKYSIIHLKMYVSWVDWLLCGRPSKSKQINLFRNLLEDLLGPTNIKFIYTQASID